MAKLAREHSRCFGKIPVAKVSFFFSPSEGFGRYLLLEIQAMATGTVKWFNDAKCFRFITAEVGNQDLFAHLSAIQGNGVNAGMKGSHVAV